MGGAWYAINGWLTWALGDLEGVVPRAREYAFDEFLRNTLTAHARAYPRRWNGVISVDDVCHAHYASDPSRCGIGIFGGWNTQIMHQPSWSLFAALKLAGLEPVRDGTASIRACRCGASPLRLPRRGHRVRARPRARVPAPAWAPCAADDGLAAGGAAARTGGRFRRGPARGQPAQRQRPEASACGRSAGVA